MKRALRVVGSAAGRGDRRRMKVRELSMRSFMGRRKFCGELGIVGRGFAQEIAENAEDAQANSIISRAEEQRVIDWIEESELRSKILGEIDVKRRNERIAEIKSKRDAHQEGVRRSYIAANHE